MAVTRRLSSMEINQTSRLIRCCFRACALACLLPGCTSDRGGRANATAPVVTAPAANSTRSNGAVTVTGMTVPEGGGFLAVHADADGAPGRRIGESTFLESGRVQRLKISTPGAGSVWVILHSDADRNRIFEYPGPDAPVKDENGSLVSQYLVVDSATSASAGQRAQPSISISSLPLSVEGKTVPTMGKSS
jgi:hypothetical protein